MKKSLTGLTALFAALILAGCGNQTQATVSQSQVTDAITAKNYGKAEGLNAAILLDKKDNKTAKATDKQLKAMIDAEDDIRNHDFDKAKTKLKDLIDIKNGSSKLVKLAKSRLKTVNTYIKTTTTYNRLLDDAKKAYSQKDYKTANSALKTLLSESNINEAAYQPIYTAALELQASVATAQGTAASSTASAESSSVAAESSSSASSSQSSSSSDSSNPAANSPENKPVTGSTDITDADLANARKDITDLGENPAYWSPNDLKRAILKARSENRTHITMDDLK
ncbi:hypothetical protein [Lacticaseibacillus saniviri]